jgi:hypothetical protein
VDREFVFTILAIVLTGVTLRLGVLWPPAECVIATSAQHSEHRCWWCVWIPLAPMVLVLCALLGWAALEPDNSELVPRSLLLLSLPCAFVWTRAIWRAVKALRRPPVVRAAGVIGLWHPRIVMSDQFRARVDDLTAAAAIAHEAAHARHRDPLRLWLAQFATDLQWPSAPAAERLRAWMRLVEFARDDEARQGGVEGADLAAAIIAAIRLSDTDGLAPALVGDRPDFETRIRRLLAPKTSDESVPSSTLELVIVAAPVLVTIAFAGARFGESLVRTVFSALP